MKTQIFTTHKFKALKRVLENHENVFEGKAQAIAAKDNFTEMVNQMAALITDLTVPLTSVYLNRVKARNTLIAQLGNILQIAIMFASRTNDEVLMNTLKSYNRRYRSVAANEMIQFANYLINALNQKMDEAAEVGITAEEIAQLQNSINNYQQAAENVALEIGERKSRRMQINDLIKNSNELLQNSIDRFVRYHNTSHPDLSFAYGRVRWRRRRKSTSGTSLEDSDISGMVSDAVTGLPIAGATVNLIEHAHALSTDAEGYYLFDHLDTGEYTIACHAPGYKVPEPFALMLSNNDAVIHNFQLTPADSEA